LPAAERQRLREEGKSAQLLMSPAEAATDETATAPQAADASPAEAASRP
jgi:hypothetical protein